jgi:hypothetical protein
MDLIRYSLHVTYTKEFMYGAAEGGNFRNRKKIEEKIFIFHPRISAADIGFVAEPRRHGRSHMETVMKIVLHKRRRIARVAERLSACQGGLGSTDLLLLTL